MKLILTLMILGSGLLFTGCLHAKEARTNLLVSAVVLPSSTVEVANIPKQSNNADSDGAIVSTNSINDTYKVVESTEGQTKRVTIFF